VIRSLSEVQKGAIFYLITLGLALLVALFGPTGAGAIQILNMLTVTTACCSCCWSSRPMGSQGWLGPAGPAPRRLPILAACTARSDGCARRLVRGRDRTRRSVLAICARHRGESGDQHCYRLVLRLLRGDRLARLHAAEAGNPVSTAGTGSRWLPARGCGTCR
jgi:hypothetical protein